MVLNFVRSLNLTNSPWKNKQIILSLPGRKHQGCDRITYPINDRWVIKVAKSKNAIRQNLMEINVWKNATKYQRQVLCAIRYYDPNALWVVQRRIQTKISKYNIISTRIAEKLERKILSLIYKYKLVDLNQIGIVGNKLKFYDYGFSHYNH